MTTARKKSEFRSQLLVAVIVALLAGGTSPWWWKELFGNGRNESETHSDVSGSPLPQSNTHSGVTDAPLPQPDFSDGSTRVYSALFSEWPTRENEHGFTKVEHGAYTLRPFSNTWIGQGRWMDIATLQQDFVIDLKFRIMERNPTASLSLGLRGSGQDADYVQAFFSVWSSEKVTYSLVKGRIKEKFYSLPEETIAKREEAPGELVGYDWVRGGTISFKRRGGTMQFFINGSFIREFPVSRFPVSQLSVQAAFDSIVKVTSIEARTP